MVNFKNYIQNLSCFLFFVISTHLHGAEYYVYSENGKKGIKQERGQVVVPANYEEIGWSDSDFKGLNGVVGFKDKGLWGLISMKNHIIIEPIYEALSISNAGGYIISSRRDKLTQMVLQGVLQSSGKVLVPPKYSKVTISHNNVIAWSPHSGNNLSKVGLLNLSNEIIIPFDYFDIRPLGSLRFLVKGMDNSLKIFSEQGIKISEFEFDNLDPYFNDRAKIYSMGKVGLIDRDGNVVLQPIYKDVLVNKNNMETLPFPIWEVLNVQGQTTYSFSYDEIFFVSKEIYKVKSNEKYWLINEQDEKFFNEGYDDISEFEDNLAICRKGRNYGIMKEDGSLMKDCTYKMIYRQGEFFFLQDGSGTWVAVDKFGVQKTKKKYEKIGNYQQYLFPVVKNGYWGFIDREGNEVINCVFDSVGQITSKFIPVKFKGLYGIIDKEGSWVVTPVKVPVLPVNDLLYIENHGHQRQVKNYDGDLVYFTENNLVKDSTYFIERLSNGNVWKIDFSGTINNGNIIKTEIQQFEEIYSFSEGLIGIRKDGKYGFVDIQNRLRIANRYDSIGFFKEGLAAIKLLNGWGFIDKQERIAVQPIYDKVYPFSGGVSVVLKNNKYFLIDKIGHVLSSPGFDKMEWLSTGKYKVKIDEKYGLVDKRGNYMVNCIYDDLKDLGNGLVIISKIGKYGVVDSSGVNKIPRIYHFIDYNKEYNFFLVKKEGAPQNISR